MQLKPITVSNDQTHQRRWQINCALNLLNAKNLQFDELIEFLQFMKYSVLRKIHRFPTRRISEKSVSMVEN